MISAEVNVSIINVFNIKLKTITTHCFLENLPFFENKVGVKSVRCQKM